MTNIIDLLSSDEQQLISDIAQTDFEELKTEIIKVGVDKVLNEYHVEGFKGLRVKGLLPLKALLAEKITAMRRKRYGYDNHPYYKEYKEKGLVVLHHYKYGAVEELHNHKKLSGIIRMIAGYQPKYQIRPWSVSRVNMVEDDPQYNLHIDTHYSVVKAWIYQEKTTDAAFNYVYTSHINTKAKLEWYYRCSLVDNPFSYSFRLNMVPTTLEVLSLPPPTPVVGDKDTLIVADTSGFHCRGKAPGTLRTSLRARENRLNPFRLDI